MENLLVLTNQVRPHAQIRTTAFLISQQIALLPRKDLLLESIPYPSQINGIVSLVLPAILAPTK